MEKKYKFCIILEHSGDAAGFVRSFESVVSADEFHETELLLVFRKKPYELDTEIVALLNNKSENIRSIIIVENASVCDILTESIRQSGAEIVLRVEEGDTIEPHLLTYSEYFFRDNSDCPALFVPVVSGSAEGGFENTPFGGLCRADDSFGLPDTLKGAVMQTVTMPNADFVEGSDCVAVVYHALLLRAILASGAYGRLNTARIISDNGAISCMAESLHFAARLCVDAIGGMPQYFTDYMREYAEAQMSLPLSEADARLDLLRTHLELGTSEPWIEIVAVENYYAQVDVSGVFYANRSDIRELTAELSAGSLCELQTQKIEECWIDRFNNKMSFRARVGLDDSVAQMRFLYGDETVAAVTLPSDLRNYGASVEDGTLSITKIVSRPHYRVSCIVPVYNGAQFLREAIESIRAQSLDFFSSTQIVLVNDGSDDDTDEICREYAQKFPYNVTYLSREHAGVSAARNAGLKVVMGKYVTFLDADDALEPKLLESGIKHLDKKENAADIVAFPIKCVAGEDTRLPSLNFRFEKTAEIDIEDKHDHTQFSACGVLLRATVLEGLEFNESLSNHEDAEFMHRLLLRQGRYSVLAEPHYLYRVHDKPRRSTNSAEFAKALTEFSLIEKSRVTQYTQYLIIHELLDGIGRSETLDDAQTEQIFDCLQYVDDVIIKYARTLSYAFKCHLLKLKHKDVTLKKTDGMSAFYVGDVHFEDLCPEIVIEKVRIKDESLCVRGYCSLPSYDGITLEAEVGGVRHEPTEVENHRHDLVFFGHTVHHAKGFAFALPILRGNATLAVRTELGEYPVRLRWNNAYCVDGRIIVTAAESGFGIAERTADKVQAAVENSIGALENQAAASELFAEYLRMYPFFAKSRIWMFSDGALSAGGNAERLFTHCKGENDNIDKHFVIRKNMPDGWRLSEAGENVLDYGSQMHKLMYLFAEKHIVSDLADSNPLSEYGNAFAGLTHCETVYIPCADISEETAKAIAEASPDYIAVISETERQALIDIGIPGDAILMTGRPEYDFIEDCRENEILFMPPCDEPLYLGENLYNPDFKDSEYCELVSGFLCDDDLFDAVEGAGFAFKYAPHEKTYTQLGDIEMDEIVEIIPQGKPRQALLQSAALLITSEATTKYSYLKKPIIYFDFTGGGISADMPFGETVSELDELTLRVRQFIENGCEIAEEYRLQAERYFAHTDKNSCKRIYDVLR